LIKQATVEDISNSRITKRHGRIVVVTRYYPRFLKRKLVDDYEGVLAPSKALLTEFKKREDEMGDDHDGAFEDISYESKFELSESGIAKLREYAALAATQDVYFVCHCRLGQRCHRELLLLMAKQMGAPVGRVYMEYPIFQERFALRTDFVVQEGDRPKGPQAR
jgi:uncharacterized protein YeaO (DUF488 family)